VPAEVPAEALDPAAALRDLWSRVDVARARGAICDGRPVPPAPELRGSVPLDEAAAALAASLLAGEAEEAKAQVKEAKFRGKLLREVVARGLPTPGLAAAAWLASPEDCRALMDPQATHGGAALVPETEGGGYVWIVLLGRKR
jgi:uncharacterized protein YkwD